MKRSDSPLTGAIARAADVGIGFPPETSLRLCIVAIALARDVGLSDEDTRDVYHAALLRHTGCTASAHEETWIAGDEIELRSAIAMGDAGKPGDMAPRLVRGLARGQSVGKRVRTVGKFLARAPSVLPNALRGRCEVATRFAMRLGLGPRVGRALDEAFERWDGEGLPAGRRGDQVSIAARIISLAELAAAYLAVGGIDAAREVVAVRSGGHVDPDLAARFIDGAEKMLADATAPSVWDRVLEIEPRPFACVGMTHQRAIAELLADFADLKSTFTLGHSRGVAARAVRGAEVLGATSEELAHVEIAALVHDIGRVAVSNALWDKPGPLARGEMEQVRTHAFHTDRIVASIGGAIGEVAGLSSAAHERLDGSGYHRALTATGLSKWPRLIAAADVAQALLEPRPHRPALSKAEADRTLRDLADRGALCRRAVDAVLDSEGGAPRKARVRLPAGLSEREVEVLKLVARGGQRAEGSQASGELELRLRPARDGNVAIVEHDGADGRLVEKIRHDGIDPPPVPRLVPHAELGTRDSAGAVSEIRVQSCYAMVIVRVHDLEDAVAGVPVSQWSSFSGTLVKDRAVRIEQVDGIEGVLDQCSEAPLAFLERARFTRPGGYVAAHGFPILPHGWARFTSELPVPGSAPAIIPERFVLRHLQRDGKRRPKADRTTRSPKPPCRRSLTPRGMRGVRCRRKRFGLFAPCLP